MRAHEGAKGDATGKVTLATGQLIAHHQPTLRRSKRSSITKKVQRFEAATKKAWKGSTGRTRKPAPKSMQQDQPYPYSHTLIPAKRNPTPTAAFPLLLAQLHKNVKSKVVH